MAPAMVGVTTSGRDWEDCRIYVNVRIHGVVVCALVDTGAARTLVSGQVLHEITQACGRQCVLRPTGTLVSVSGEELHVEGETEVMVDDVGPMRVVVMNKMHHPCILGWDQLQRYGASIDGRQLVLRWGGERPPFQHGPHPASRSINSAAFPLGPRPLRL